MRELQQSNDRKRAIDDSITKARKKKIKMSAVDLRAENQSVVATTITVFINAQLSHNESRTISRSHHMNGIYAGGNRQAAATAKRPAQIGGHNSNNRDDINQISYDHFGNLIN